MIVFEPVSYTFDCWVKPFKPSNVICQLKNTYLDNRNLMMTTMINLW